MANATPSRSGQSNLAGDPLALFLKVYAGEVLEAFDRESAFRQRHLVRVIPSGKSASFPVTGLAASRYHTPGAEIPGQSIAHAERIISIEDLLISDVFVASIDELMNHFEVRGIYSDAQGQAMAKRYDQNVSRVGILAARSAAAVTGLQAGAQATDADFSTDGGKLWAAVFNAGVTFDQNDVPQSDRNAFFRPVQYALIVRSEKPINRDLNDPNGSLAQGTVYQVNSIPIVKTNNLVNTNDFTVPAVDQPASRQHDYSTTMGLVAHRQAMGTVQLQDVTMESAYDIRRQGTLMVGKYLVGHGPLRAEGAYEIRTSAPAG